MTSLISGSVDFSKIEKYFKNIESNYDNIKKSILQKAQQSLLNNLQRLAPRNTGEYANSWKLGELTTNSATIITPMGKLFILLEFTGSSPHTITAKNKKTLKFTDKGGNVIFRLSVKHPGFDKIPHAQPALELTFKEIPEILKEELGKII